MLCKIGFLTYRNEKTKKEHPFFVKVRQKDIISDKIELSTFMKKVSSLFDESSVHNNISTTPPNEYTPVVVTPEGTTYTFYTNPNMSGNDTDTDRPLHNYFSSKLYYKLFNDNTFEICGKFNAQCKKTETIGDSTYYVLSMILPYMPDSENITYMDSYVSCESYKLVSNIGNLLPATISNTDFISSCGGSIQNCLLKIRVKTSETFGTSLSAEGKIATCGFNIKGFL